VLLASNVSSKAGPRLVRDAASDSANPSTNSGDTIYHLPGANHAGSFFSCIWDTGGTDAIDLSNDTLGALSIETGDGNDTVDLSTITINGVQAAGDTDDDRGDGEGGDGEHGGCEGRGWERGHGPFGDGPVFGNGPWDHPEHDEHTLGGSLTIRTGDGNDTIHLTSVTEASGEESSDPWSFCDHRWSFGQQWQIILGSGNDTVTFDSVQTNQSLRVIGGTGDDTVNVNDSTINGRANIALLSGDDQINVNTSTFDESARLSTGSGDGQTISVNDSTFQESAKLSVPGTDAQLNLETGGISGLGTTFEGPVRISLSGPSAVANFASATFSGDADLDGHLRQSARRAVQRGRDRFGSQFGRRY
jgi:serralysin